MINTLIDRKLLVKEKAHRVMRGSLDATDISSTIHGVISDRLDHLQPETKRILQEASVIGRVFDYAILQQISAAGPHLDTVLEALQQVDMIREKDDVQEVKYAFKHAFVQEVVYNGILIRDRRAIHERIAVAKERLFHTRLSGLYETLAFHYSVGQSVSKAVDYLMKSGRKSKQRYAVDEAHQYYQRAYELLQDHPDRIAERALLPANILIQCFFVFNVRGIFNEMIDVCGMGRFAAGDLTQCIESCNMAIASSAELVHSFISKFLLACTYLSNEQVDEADQILTEIVHFTETHGYEYIGTAARALGGMVMLARGQAKHRLPDDTGADGSFSQARQAIPFHDLRIPARQDLPSTGPAQSPPETGRDSQEFTVSTAPHAPGRPQGGMAAPPGRRRTAPWPCFNGAMPMATWKRRGPSSHPNR